MQCVHTYTHNNPRGLPFPFPLEATPRRTGNRRTPLTGSDWKRWEKKNGGQVCLWIVLPGHVSRFRFFIYLTTFHFIVFEILSVARQVSFPVESHSQLIISSASKTPYGRADQPAAFFFTAGVLPASWRSEKGEGAVICTDVMCEIRIFCGVCYKLSP